MFKTVKGPSKGIKNLVDPLTGLVTDLAVAHTQMSDPEIFEVTATLCETSVYGYGNGRSRIVGAGLGLDLNSAIGAAIGEALERYSLCIMNEEDLLFGTFNELCRKGYHLVPPYKWALFDKTQYNHIPFSPFDTDTALSWVRSENLTSRMEFLVPACLVYLPYNPPFADNGEKLVYMNTSTGAACGKSAADVILKGICEIIERDAFIIMWRNRLSLTRVSIDRESTLFEIFEQKFNKPGLKYYLIYTRLDLAIPSFFGILIDSRCGFSSISVAGAAHPDPEQAALKTLLELAQGFRYKNYLRIRRFYAGYNFTNVRSFEDRIMLYAFNDMHDSFSFLLRHSKEIPLSSIASMHKDNNRDSLRSLLTNLSENNLDVLAVDMTPRDIYSCGLRVARVLIPQCDSIESDHLMPLLGGTRWREIPFKLGLIPQKNDIMSINHIPHPYP